LHGALNGLSIDLHALAGIVRLIEEHRRTGRGATVRLDTIREQIDTAQATIERARGAIDDGGARPLDAMVNPAGRSEELELREHLDRSMVEVAQVRLPIDNAELIPVPAAADRLDALSEWAESACTRLRLAMQNEQTDHTSGHTHASQYVTRDQIAAITKRKKSTITKFANDMPAPVNSPKRGQPLLYKWSVVRPWAEDKFGMQLPAIYPAERPPL